MTDAIDVVIPTWNRRDLLERCLPTVLRQTVPVRVIVVDNGSEDGSVAVVRERFGHAVSVIALPENRGFGAAVNAGVRAGEGALVVLVNNDVECDPGFAEALAAPFADPRVGMAAGL
ncbi:MAG TPA: glycosyltransferase, partial [Solirubrobacteraceae bacterium]|nr:glycosyltransferase [Solirubrobacteraceae bacterium]